MRQVPWIRALGRTGGCVLRPRLAVGLILFVGVMAVFAMRMDAPTRAAGFDPSGAVDQRYVPPTATAVSNVKTCPDGSVELLGSTCPAPQQICPDGEMIYTTQVCPGATTAGAASDGPPAATGSGNPSDGGGAGSPTVTVCGTASSFNPATQSGVLAATATVSVGQVLLCGANFTAGPGCQPSGESVDFGDGSQQFVSSQLQGASHAYSQPGVYSVTDTIMSCPASVAASITVAAIPGAGSSPASASAAPSCTQPPSMPTNVTVTAQPDLFHALISWSDSGDASNFQIASGNGSLIATAGAAITQYAAGSWYDTGTGGMIQVAPTGWWDSFSVTALNSCGSSPSAWGQVRMPCPDGLAGDAQGDAASSCLRMAAANPG
jgi:PKD repeat protein